MSYIGKIQKQRSTSVILKVHLRLFTLNYTQCYIRCT